MSIAPLAIQRPTGHLDRAPAVRVVSVPADHPYVRSVTNSPGITVLPDPPTSTGVGGRWWPPAALDAGWILANAGDAELLHVHFGTESFSAVHLSRCLAAARAVGWPIVFTVHDLEHPQLSDQSAYCAQLDVLVPGADAVLTLTPGAAWQIGERWGREAIIVPHPALFASPGLPPVPARESAPRRVGVFLKDLRPNVDAAGVVNAMAAALESLSGTDLAIVAQVHIHRQVRDESAGDLVRSVVGRSDHLTLIEHDRLTDDRLATELAGLDACILPYGHGTHSGWLELCWDLAVPLVVPDVGFFAEQHRDPTVAVYTPEESGASLASALLAVLTGPGSTRPGTPERAAVFDARRMTRAVDDAATVETHAQLYRRLVSGGRP